MKRKFTMVQTPTPSTESKISIRPYFDSRSGKYGIRKLWIKFI